MQSSLLQPIIHLLFFLSRMFSFINSSSSTEELIAAIGLEAGHEHTRWHIELLQQARGAFDVGEEDFQSVLDRSLPARHGGGPRLALGQFTPGPILMVAAYVGYKIAGMAGAAVAA